MNAPRTEDEGVSRPAAAALATGSTNQAAPPGSLPGDREAFSLLLERHMHAMVRELEDLIDLHQQWGDTLQKTYLYRARAALKDGLNWFVWTRERAAEKKQV